MKTNKIIYMTLSVIFSIIVITTLSITLQNKTNKLQNTNWSIVNSNSNSSFVKLDFIPKSKIYIKTFDNLNYTNPNSILQSKSRKDNLTFWTTGYNTVYTGIIKDNKLIIDASYDIFNKNITANYFITSSKNNLPEYYYVLFSNSLDRFYFKNNQIINESCIFDIDDTDELITANITTSGYIVIVSKNANIFCSNTYNIFNKNNFNQTNFIRFKLNCKKFYTNFSNYGLLDNHDLFPFNENEIIYNNVKLQDNLFISNYIGIGNENTKYSDNIYISTYVGIVSIDCKAIIKKKKWENIVTNFFPIPRKLNNKHVTKSSKPFLFRINKNDYLIIVDGLLPCGLCIYNLKNINQKPIIYQKIHFIQDDLTVCQNSISIYKNHNSIDICLVNKYIGDQTKNYIEKSNTKPRNLGIISLINEKNNKKNTENRLEFSKNYTKIDKHIFGFFSKGIKLLNFKPITESIKDLKEIWVNKNLGAVNCRLTITPKYVLFIGIEYSKENGLLNFIALDRNTGDLKISKTINKENIKNFLSNSSNTDISILKHKNKKCIIWGSFLGLNWITDI